MKSWAKNLHNGVLLNLYIQPGAASNKVSGIHGERLKIKIKAQPQDGEANEGLIEFLSDILKVSKSKLHFVRGESSRQKDILVELPLEEVLILLQGLLK
jgi:uncharacterized protein (TIGR00251 family)